MIHSFAYRSPRIPTSVPVEFLTEYGVLSGVTRDISQRGLSADFGEPVPVGTRGRVRFRTGHCLLELQAEVTHTEGFTVGLVLLFSSEQEIAFVRSILEALMHAADRPEA